MANRILKGKGTNGHLSTAEPPPHNIESEEDLVGSLLLMPEKISDALAVAKPRDVYTPQLRELLSATARLHAQGRTVDETTVADEVLRADAWGYPEPIVKCIKRILDRVPHGAHAVYHAGIVREFARKREFIYAATQGIKNASDPIISAAQLYADLHEAEPDVGADILTGITSAELEAGNYEVDYLVEDWIVRGQPGGIFGGKKCLKTSLSTAIAMPMSIGGQLFGRFNIPRPIRVGILSGESGAATIRETARRQAKAMGWDLAQFKNIIWEFRLPLLDQPDQLLSLDRFIRRHRLECVILDPTYLCLRLGDGAGNLFSVGEKLAPLTKLGQETGCTILIVHHTRKNTVDPFATPELEDIAWAGFQEWVRQWIILGRREAFDPESPGTHQLWASVGGSAGHCGLWAINVEEGRRRDEGGRKWQLELMPASQARAMAIETQSEIKEARLTERQQKAFDRDHERVLKALNRFPGGETAKHLREHSQLNAARFGAVIFNMVESHQAEACTVTKSGKEYDAFKLTGTNGTNGTNGTCPGGGGGGGQLPPIGGCPSPPPHLNGRKAEGPGQLFPHTREDQF